MDLTVDGTLRGAAQVTGAWVTVEGRWIGSADVTDRSNLTVTVGKNGVWEMSPDSPTMTLANGETVQDPTIASLGTGGTLTLTDNGRVSGLILVSGTTTTEEEASDRDPSRLTAEVNGVLSGTVDANGGAEAQVTVNPGGVWENAPNQTPDTALSINGGSLTVTDNGVMRGTALAVESGASLDITVGTGGVWTMGNDSITGKPGSAAALDTAELKIAVNEGGTLNGNVLLRDNATGSVTNSGTWSGSAEAKGSALTITNAGTWTGDAWADKDGKADVTVSGTWNGTIRDPGLTDHASYYTGEETNEAASGTTVLKAVRLLAVTDTNTAADPAVPVTVTLTGPDAVWNMTGSAEAASVDIGSGRVNFPTAAGTASGSTLTVDGDFTSDGGTVALSSDFGTGSGASDLLLVKGNTSGTANLVVTPVLASGTQAKDGIKVVDVDGTSDAVFTAAPVKAGAYLYHLEKSGNDWYLSDLLTPITDPAALSGVSAGFAGHPVRLEFGSYANNLYAANTMFAMKLSDRLGETAFSDALKSEKNSGNVWIRTAGGHTRNEMADGQTTARGNWGLVQVGGDVVTWPVSGSLRAHVGLMAGYAHEKSKSGGSIVNYQSKGKVSGFSGGLYATLMNPNPTGAGPYADAWLVYRRFKNTVTSDGPDETYHTKGFTGSLEAGYTFALKDWQNGAVSNAARLRLEGQVIRMGVRGGDHFESSTGTLVQGTGAGNVRTRVGATAYHLFTNDTRGTAVKPYLTLSWIHDTKSFGASMNGVKDTIEGSRNVGEVKAGVEGKLRKNVNLWGSVGYQGGTDGFRNVEALLGAKILF